MQSRPPQASSQSSDTYEDMGAQREKQQLRLQYLALRAAQPPETFRAASLAIQQRIAQIPAVRHARQALLYVAVRGEVAMGWLLAHLLTKGVQVLLPRCIPDVHGALELRCLSSASQLIPGSYRIPEPDPACCPLAEDAVPQVALIPGIAYDRHGARLGHGGGYYDRLLALPSMADTLTIAPVFSFQMAQKIPTAPWDRPVRLIVTEHESIETHA